MTTLMNPRLPNTKLVTLCAMLICAVELQAQIPIVPDWSYDQANGIGFFSPEPSPVAGHASLGELRRATFIAAANYVGSLVSPAYAGETIRIQVGFTNIAGATIANAGPLGYTNNFGSTNPRYLPDTDYPLSLANHLAGRELFSGNTIVVNFNLNPNIVWNYDTNDTPPLGTGQESFFTTAVHEILHGVPFLTYINTTDGSFDGFPTIFNRHIVEGTNPPVRFTDLSNAQRLVAMTNDNLYWNGPLAVAANGGVPLKLFAPSPYQEGSSVSHLDTTVFDPFGLVQLPRESSLAKAELALVGFERAMMYDLGWTPARPRLLSITNGVGGFHISATSILKAKYRLRFTDSLSTGGSMTNWSIISGVHTGGWHTVTFTNAPPSETGFFGVEIIP